MLGTFFGLMLLISWFTFTAYLFLMHNMKQVFRTLIHPSFMSYEGPLKRVIQCSDQCEVINIGLNANHVSLVHVHDLKDGLYKLLAIHEDGLQYAVFESETPFDWVTDMRGVTTHVVTPTKVRTYMRLLKLNGTFTLIEYPQMSYPIPLTLRSRSTTFQRMQHDRNMSMCLENGVTLYRPWGPELYLLNPDEQSIRRVCTDMVPPRFIMTPQCFKSNKDGNCTAALSDPMHDMTRGIVYIFKWHKDDPIAHLDSVIHAPVPHGMFGNQCAWIKDSLIVSAPCAEEGCGAVFIMSKYKHEWQVERTLRGEKGVEKNNYGYIMSVSPCGTWLLIGSNDIGLGTITYLRYQYGSFIAREVYCTHMGNPELLQNSLVNDMGHALIASKNEVNILFAKC